MSYKANLPGRTVAVAVAKPAYEGASAIEVLEVDIEIAFSAEAKSVLHAERRARPISSHGVRFALSRPCYVLPTVSKNAPVGMKAVQTVRNVPTCSLLHFVGNTT